MEEDTARPTGAGPEGVVYSFYHHTGLDQAFQKDISPPITVGSTLEGVANAPAVAYCLHSDALGRSGKAVTPSADAEGRVRLRPPGVGVLDGDLSYTLAASNPHAIAYQCHGGKVGPMGTLRKGDGGLTSGVPFVLDGPVVRRLTPLECERLQGFPDNHTLVPWKGRAGKNIEEVCNHLSYLLGRKVSADEARELAADAPRYKSVGNSMTVNVMRWIGVRLKAAHEGGS